MNSQQIIKSAEKILKIAGTVESEKLVLENGIPIYHHEYTRPFGPEFSNEDDEILEEFGGLEALADFYGEELAEHADIIRYIGDNNQEDKIYAGLELNAPVSDMINLGNLSIDQVYQLLDRSDVNKQEKEEILNKLLEK